MLGIEEVVTIDVRHRVLLATLVIVLGGVTYALEHRRRTWSECAPGRGDVVLERRAEALELIEAVLPPSKGDVLGKEAVDPMRWLPCDRARSIDECRMEIREMLPSAPMDAVDDLLARCEKRVEFAVDELAGNWRVVPASTVTWPDRALFCGCGGPTDPPGIERVGAPGFSADGREAVIYASGALGNFRFNSGELLHVRRTDSGWVIVGRAPTSH